jgi:hypothetical protein
MLNSRVGQPRDLVELYIESCDIQAQFMV